MFLKDDSSSWYSGQLILTYCEIINNIIQTCQLSSQNVFSIGVSMGGYAALYYSIKLGFNSTLIIDPQVDQSSVKKWITTQQLIIEDLPQLLKSTPRIPSVILMHTNNTDDEQSATKIIEALKSRDEYHLIIKKSNIKQHGFYYPSQEVILAIFDYVGLDFSNALKL